MDGSTECVADAEFHEAGEELGDAADEDGHAEDGLVRANATHGIRVRKTKNKVNDDPIKVFRKCSLPCSAVVQAQDESRQGKGDETQGTRVGNFVEGGIVDL